MIQVKSVSMNYGKTVALDNVSFSAEKGKIVGLLGPNAAGKTTLMRILTTYLYPTKGTAIVNGYDVTKNPLSVRRDIGYMPETVPLYEDMLVDDYLIFIGKARGLAGDVLRARLRWVRENCALNLIWRHSISEISKGFRQRVGLAQALIHNPEVLILDEPMTGLDPLQIISIRELIRTLAKDKTVIFSTHILQEVEVLGDRIVILNNGRVIIDGTREEIIRISTKGEKLTLVVQAEREEVEAALKNEDVVDGLHFGGSEGSKYTKFLINAETGKPLTLRLNEIIEEKGWKIRELKREQASLEEAFIWLLSKDLKKKKV